MRRKCACGGVGGHTLPEKGEVGAGKTLRSCCSPGNGRPQSTSRHSRRPTKPLCCPPVLISSSAAGRGTNTLRIHTAISPLQERKQRCGLDFPRLARHWTAAAIPSPCLGADHPLHHTCSHTPGHASDKLPKRVGFGEGGWGGCERGGGSPAIHPASIQRAIPKPKGGFSHVSLLRGGPTSPSHSPHTSSRVCSGVGQPETSRLVRHVGPVRKWRISGRGYGVATPSATLTPDSNPRGMEARSCSQASGGRGGGYATPAIGP